MTDKEYETIKDLIKRRRYQIRVHACIYYIYNDNLITDAIFDKWVQELVGLQLAFPEISKTVELYDIFKDFSCADDAINLNLKDEDLLSRAESLLKSNK